MKVKIQFGTLAFDAIIVNTKSCLDFTVLTYFLSPTNLQDRLFENSFIRVAMMKKIYLLSTFLLTSPYYDA